MNKQKVKKYMSNLGYAALSSGSPSSVTGNSNSSLAEILYSEGNTEEARKVQDQYDKNGTIAALSSIMIPQLGVELVTAPVRFIGENAVGLFADSGLSTIGNALDGKFYPGHHYLRNGLGFLGFMLGASAGRAITKEPQAIYDIAKPNAKYFKSKEGQAEIKRVLADTAKKNNTNESNYLGVDTDIYNDIINTKVKTSPWESILMKYRNVNGYSDWDKAVIRLNMAREREAILGTLAHESQHEAQKKLGQKVIIDGEERTLRPALTENHGPVNKNNPISSEVNEKILGRTQRWGNNLDEINANLSKLQEELKDPNTYAFMDAEHQKIVRNTLSAIHQIPPDKMDTILMQMSMNFYNRGGKMQSLINWSKTNDTLLGKSGIHIKPENKGKFTATKKRTGKTTEELTHSKNPVTRKRAIFAQNAKKWHHKKHEFGGIIDKPKSLLDHANTERNLWNLSR